MDSTWFRSDMANNLIPFGTEFYCIGGYAECYRVSAQYTGDANERDKSLTDIWFRLEKIVNDQQLWRSNHKMAQLSERK